MTPISLASPPPNVLQSGQNITGGMRNCARFMTTVSTGDVLTPNRGACGSALCRYLISFHTICAFDRSASGMGCM
jgi:hypothetical protein